MSAVLLDVSIDDSSDKTVSGVVVFDRSIGGTLVAPSGTVFPGSPVSGEVFWRTDQAKLYRYNGTGWDAVTTAVAAHASTHVTGGSDVIPSAVSAGNAGLMTGADKAKLDGVASGATNTPLSAVSPADVTKAAAAVGTAPSAARADHKHDVSTATVVNVGTANSEGSSTSLARADHVHAHGNQAGGALHADAVAAGASGFMTGADKTKLDGVEAGAQVVTFSRVQTALNAATGTVGVNNQLVSNVATPVASTDAATKGYVDAIANGRDYKDACRLATTANVTLSGLQTIDGVAGAAGDRILVKNQTTASENGIYVMASGAWSRAEDANASAEVTNGMHTDVTAGSTQATTGWTLTTADPIALGTTALTFVQTLASAFSLASTAPANVTKSAASVGVGVTAARADHKHDISTAAPTVGIGSGNAEGVNTTLARSDHGHALREGGGTDLILGGIANGQYLVRSGGTILGATLPAQAVLQTGFINVVANTTLTSTAFTTLLTLTPTVQAGSRLVIRASGAVSSSANNTNNRLRVTVDGVSVGGVQMRNSTANVAVGFAFEFRTAALTAGAHTIALQWAAASGTIQCRPVANPDAESACLSITEVTV